MKKVVFSIFFILSFFIKSEAGTFPVVAGEVRGIAYPAGTTRYSAIKGILVDTNASQEALNQFTIRDTFTLANLYVRVIANDATAQSTVNSRKNTAAGAQSVSIGAGLTGVFQDTSDSDSLIDGDLVNSQIIVGAGGALTVSLIGYTLNGNSGIFMSPANWSTAINVTNYININGDGRQAVNEVRPPYVIRENFTLSNLQVYVLTNGQDATGTTIYRTRKNGGNGNQSITVLSGQTGAFEDASGTDSVIPGDTIDYQIVTAGVSGGIVTRLWSVKHNLPNATWLINGSTGGTTISFGSTVNIAVEGNPQFTTTTEADSQITAQTGFVTKNMFIRVTANSVNGTTTARLRKNSANGNLGAAISISASTTGAFEDTVNRDFLDSSDVINFQIITGGSSGTILVNYVGMEAAPYSVTKLNNARVNNMSVK